MRWMTKAGLAALGLVMAQPAVADLSELYLGLGAGVNYATDSDLSAPANTTVDHDLGWGGIGTFGLKWFDRVRTEVEGGYRSNGVDSVGNVNGSGDVDVTSLMLNVLYDVPTSTRLSPYFGIGAGGLRGKYDGVSPITGRSISDSDTAFGYQGIAGLSWKVSEVVSLFADYRYTRSTDFSFNGAGGSFDAEWASHAAFFGLRFTLWKPTPAAAPMVTPAVAPAPAPAPVAAPAPAPAPAAPAAPRQYMVFFGHDEADLTPQARQIIAQAADNAKKGGVSRLMLTGHADRSGTDRYNLRLSERRANAVRDELVRLGVGANTIGTDFKGESQPLVPTADGVREPQNRRVEIRFN